MGEKRALKCNPFGANHVTKCYRICKMADKDVEEKTIAEDLVVTKYKLAGEIVNRE